ncbi:MAG TPA: tetratricopeptide repeat protein [Phycisphaerae bacterium]|nr:tetratricopeptide repeat protein [Phycisphaerae bacterium]
MKRPERNTLRVVLVAAVLCVLSVQRAPGDVVGASTDAGLQAYHSGNGLLNRGLYELAAAEYRKFLEANAEHAKAPAARYGLGVCLFRMEQFEAAAAELVGLQKEGEFAYAAEVATILGQCHLALKDYAAAAEAFDRVLGDHADHDLADEAAVGRAEALYLAGQLAEAVRQCEQLRTRRPKSPLCDRAQYFQGLAEMGQNDYAAAAKLFSGLSKKETPFADQVCLLLAQCYHRNEEPTEAARWYRQVLERADSEYVCDALHGLGALQLQEGKPDEAGVALDRLLKEFPTSRLGASAHLLRGRAWFDQGRFGEALESFQRVGNDSGDLRDDAAYWSAKCALRQGRFADAAGSLKEAIERFPESPLAAEMLYDRSVALSRTGEDEAAVETLSEFRSRFADHAMSADALHLLALVVHRMGRYDESREHCRAFLDQYPRHALASAVVFLSAENDFLAGKYGEAVDGYRRFLAGDPEEAEAATASYRLGMALYRSDRFDEAEPLLSAVCEVAGAATDYRPAFLALGDICFRRGAWESAERWLRAYLSGGDGEVAAADDALLKLGLAHQRQGEYEEALSAYDRLIKRHEGSPHFLQAVFERGQSLAALTRLDDARGAFERVLTEGGDSRFAAYARNHLGALAAKAKDFATAAEYYDAAQSGSSDDGLRAEALFQEGQTLMAAQRFKAAEEVLERFLESFPSHARAAEARVHRAVALSRQDKHSEALGAIEQAERQAGSKLAPSLRIAVAYEKAWCLRESGKTDEAAEQYRELLEAGPPVTTRVHALLELGAIEAEAKRYEQAAGALRELRGIQDGEPAAVPVDIREQATYRLAVCEYELDRYAEAVGLFEEMIDEFPNSALIASASFYCGEALFNLGRHERSARHLERVVKEFPSDPVCPVSLLRLGECLAAVQRWARSEEVFEQYLERFGDTEHWFQARFGIGWARENQGRFDEAIGAYREVVSRHQGPTAARAQFQIGECLFAKEEYKAAAAELLKVDILYAYPEWSAAALYEAGRCFLKLGQSVEARSQFKLVSQKYEQSRWADMAAERLSETSGGALPGR